MRHIPATIRHAQAAVLGLTRLSPGERITLAAIVGRLNGNGTGSCYANYATLEADTGIAERSLRRHLQALMDALVIEPAARGLCLTPATRADLFPPLATPDGPDPAPDSSPKPDPAKMANDPDKLADRRKGFNVSPSEKLSLREIPDKPDWLGVDLAAFRILQAWAKKASQQLGAVLEAAKPYVKAHRLAGRQLMAYLRTMINSGKDYAWVKKVAEKKAKQAVEAAAAEDQVARLEGRILTTPKGVRYEVRGGCASPCELMSRFPSYPGPLLREALAAGFLVPVGGA